MKIVLVLATMALVVSCGRDGVYHSHPGYYHRGPNAPHDFRDHPTNQIINECGSNYTITPYVEDANGTTVNVFCGDRIPQYPHINWNNWQYANQYQWQGMQYYFWY